MAELDVNIIPKSVDNAAQNLTDASTKAIGQTLSEIWYLILGGPIHQAALKRETRYAVDVEKFKEEILNKVEKIPKENLIEPNFQVASAAFNDSKFCLEDEELRKMFANLIAASSDSSKATSALPIFSDIIRKMTYRDASNLSVFKTDIGITIPVVKYIERWLDEPGYNETATNVFLANPQFSDIEGQSASISTLCALGLISVDYQAYCPYPNAYDPFLKTKMYKELLIKKNQRNAAVEKAMKFPEGLRTVAGINVTPQHVAALEVPRGAAQLTPLGLLFKKTCID